MRQHAIEPFGPWMNRLPGVLHAPAGDRIGPRIAALKPAIATGPAHRRRAGGRRSFFGFENGGVQFRQTAARARDNRDDRTTKFPRQTWDINLNFRRLGQIDHV